MDDAARGEGKSSRGRAHRALAELKGQFAFEDVKGLILALVDVRRRPGGRRRCCDLPKSVGTARVLVRGFEPLVVTEDRDTLPFSRSEQDHFSDSHQVPLSIDFCRAGL